MPTMRPKARIIFVAVFVLTLAAAYYLRPVWWESYRYENDQIRVRLNSHDGTDPPNLAGTLVVRLTGPGRPLCGWDPISRKTVGPAREQLLRFESVTSSLTDAQGYADAAPHGGFGRGERGLLGGCRYNRGYLLIMSRPGFETRVARPHVGRINHSGQVLSQARSRDAKTSKFDYAQRRLKLAMKLLYPSPIFDDSSELGRQHDQTIAASMPAYWQHRLPDGRRLRDYAVENLRAVSQGIDCPVLTAGVTSTFPDNADAPASQEAIFAEHRALATLLRHPAPDSAPCIPP